MAVEIPLKPRQLHPGGKKQASKSSMSGSTGGKKHKATNGVAAIVRAEQQKESRARTALNKKILIIDARGKRHFILLSEYEAR